MGLNAENCQVSAGLFASCDLFGFLLWSVGVVVSSSTRLLCLIKPRHDPCSMGEQLSRHLPLLCAAGSTECYSPNLGFSFQLISSSSTCWTKHVSVHASFGKGLCIVLSLPFVHDVICKLYSSLFLCLCFIRMLGEGVWAGVFFCFVFGVFVCVGGGGGGGGGVCVCVCDMLIAAD